MSLLLRNSLVALAVITAAALSSCGGAGAPQPGNGGTPQSPGTLQFPAPQPGVQMPTAPPAEIDFDDSGKSPSAVYRIFFRDSVNESSGGRWTVVNTSGAKQWTLSNTYFSAPKAWVLGQNYWNRETDVLISNSFNVADGEDGLAVTFVARWNIAAGDHGTVYYNEGLNSQQVIDFSAGSNPSYPGWDKYYFKLPKNVSGLAQNCNVAFSFTSDTALTNWGFGVDNVAVYQTQLGSVTDLAASDGTSAGQVDLSWSHNNQGNLVPDGYDIYRAGDDDGMPGSYSLLTSVAYPTNNYSDPTGNASFYWYKVVATKAGWPAGADSNVDGGHGSGTWNTLTADNGGDYGYYTSFATNGAGKPAIAYYNNDTGDLMYDYSDLIDGSGNWHTVTVDGALINAGDFYPSLALVNGVPAISYYDATNTHLKFAYSANAVGDGGWTTLDVDANPNVGQYSSLALINGKPAISYYDSTNNLRYAYSTTVDGSGGWNVVTADATASAGIYTSLAQVNGYPAIAYFNGNTHDLRYAYSSMPDGSSGWNAVDVDTTNSTGLYPSLAVVNGKPAISYFDNTNGDLRYAWSNLPDGSSNWNNFLVDSTGVVGENSSLAVVYGYPMISYYDQTNGDLKLATSTALDGSGAWSSITLDSTGFVGKFTSLGTISGAHPAISYFDETNTSVKFAYYE